MKILKFGGTSVGSPARMKQVADLISEDQEEKIVVLSAVSGTTNKLVKISSLIQEKSKKSAREAINDLQESYDVFISDLVSSAGLKEHVSEVIIEHFESLRALANVSFNEGTGKEILAQGELLSTNLFQILMEERGQSSHLIPALEFMVLDEDCEPDIVKITKSLSHILESSKDKNIHITQGFICLNHRGEIDNLQRGGSDYSASLIGAASRASEIQIWTDIDGMHNNDPRVVKNTFPIAELSFNEAAELAYFGAKILHPSSILPAQKFNIPVRLLNTMKPEAKGTVISDKESPGNIKAIAAKDNITAIKIRSSRMLLAYGFLRSVFEVFENHKTPIDMITTSEVAVSITIDDETHLQAILSELRTFGSVEVDRNQTIVCLVGDMVSEKLGVMTKVFDAMSDIPIRMVSYGGSRNNVSILINSEFKEAALNSLNDGVFASLAT